VKIAVANIDGIATLVTMVDGQWIDLSRAYHDYQRIIDFIDGHMMHSYEELSQRGLFNLAFYERIVDYLRKPGMFAEYALLGEPAFLQPLRPGKVLSVGRNFHAFLEQQGVPVPDEPVFYAKSASICIGPGQPILLRERYGRVDHEGELAVVIGKRAQDVPADEAYHYVAGYTIINDVTARDMQQRDMALGYPWYRAKNLATFCPVGPAILARDALPWPPHFDIAVHVNGEERQHGNTRDLIFGIPEIIAAITQFIPLDPGDLVSTGTPSGVSPLVPGDCVQITIDGIGTLENPVAGAGD
jgi:2-keto-4-pentenoate hydratase/2-oxohepta-3-ene-1,7-dioic acid hydratase in catechol pathway